MSQINVFLYKTLRKIPVAGSFLAQLYIKHISFFNDGVVELVCLLIANGFVAYVSYYVIGVGLALLSLLVVTPVTFCLKYFLHKYWVWKVEEQI